MNPHQKNKIDISTLSADEQRLFRLYGKLPNKKDLLQNKLKERKYFDSGDYALSKAGKASDTGVTTIGTEHPQAENIPHLSASSPPNSASLPATSGSINSIDHHTSSSHFLPGSAGHRGSIQGMQLQQGGQSRSPVKESSYLARTASVDEEADGAEAAQKKMMLNESGREGSEGAVLEDTSVSPPPTKGGLPIRR